MGYHTMSNLTRFVIELNNIGERIDKYVSMLFPDISRTRIQKLITEQCILVNNNKVKSNYKLNQGDIITVELPEAIEPEILAEDIPLDIIYEDDDVIVINKPKQMVVHPAKGHYTGTLVNALMYHCKDNLSGINGVMRPGIVHRIDMDTTGVLMIAKNDFAHNKLAEQLKEHSISRVYEAIVHNVIDEDEGTIQAKIGRHPNNRLKMEVSVNDGKDAITHYSVIERFSKYTHIECRLETGRTHQIRVHMSSIGYPLLGDTVYGPGGKSPFHLTGQTLHARLLGFIHPRTNEYMEFTAPRPEYFSHLIDVLRVSK